MKDYFNVKGVFLNSSTKAVYIAITISIELYYTKFLISNIGADAYGIIPLAANTILIASIFSYVIFHSLGRFLIIEVHQRRINDANITFNVTLIGYVIGVLLFIPIAVLFISYSDRILNLPLKHEIQSKYLLASSIGAFLIMTLSTIFRIGAFVENRIYWNDILEIVKVLISRVLSIALIVALNIGLYGVCIGLITAAVTGFFLSLYLFNKLLINIRVSLSYWCAKKARVLISYAKWLFVRQVSGSILIYVDVIIVNILYGSYETGIYGLASFFSTRLKVLSGTFASLLTPIITRRYSENDYDGMVSVVCKSIRLIGIVFALPVGLFCGLYSLIFNLWIGPEYSALKYLAIMLTCHISLNISSFPLFSVLTAMDKQKTPSLVMSGAALLNVLLAILIGWPSKGLGLVGVALASGISVTLNHFIFTPVYTSKLLKIKSIKLYKEYLPGIIGCMYIMFASSLVSICIANEGISKLIIIFTVVSFMYVLFAWLLLMNKEDRLFVHLKIFSRFKGKYGPA